MTGWKEKLQVGDLERDDRFELICRRCGHLRYLKVSTVLKRRGGSMLYLCEVEKRTRCIERGCGSVMRLAMPRKDDAAGFVGGLA